MGINQEYDKGGRQKLQYSESDVVSVSCPLCDSGDYKKIYCERASLGIVRCSKCDLVYVNPRLKDPETLYWGEVDKYLQEARLIFEGKAPHHRDKNYLADLKTISKFKPSGNFLDIGTNMGFFLRKARNRGWNLYGVEPSPALSEIARKYFGLNVKTAFLADAKFEPDFFDVVTLTDVFEHLTHPGQILEEIRRILKPDGIVYIKVPNGLFNLLKLKIAKFTKRLNCYDIFDSYEHVLHFSHSTLKAILEKNGFQILKMKIARPVQLPVWHKYVGFYYQYPSPWILDPLQSTLRTLFFILSLIEFKLRFNKIGYFAPNIIAIAKKK